MKLIKRKILLETLISRAEGPTYGKITAKTIHVPIFIVQNFKDIGLRENLPFTQAIGPVQELTGTTFNVRLTGTTVDDYYHDGGTLSGESKSRVVEAQTYGATQYVDNFPVDIRDYTNYNGDLVEDAVTQVFEHDNNTGARYTILGDPADPNFGTTAQTSGIYFEDDYTTFRSYVDDLGIEKTTPSSKFYVKNEGSNFSNTSLSANTKLETYLGVVFPPKTKSEVFIERGLNVILEPHLKLSEIESVDHLQRYGNGYFTITKQNI